MKVQCPRCGLTYRLSDDRLPPDGGTIRIRCRRCAGFLDVVPDTPDSSDTVPQEPPTDLPPKAPPLEQQTVLPPDAPWFVAIRGERTGPHTTPQVMELLRAKTIASDTLVWRKGFSQWVALAEVGELRSPWSAAKKTSEGEARSFSVPRPPTVQTRVPRLVQVPGASPPPAPAGTGLVELMQPEVARGDWRLGTWGFILLLIGVACVGILVGWLISRHAPPSLLRTGGLGNTPTAVTLPKPLPTSETNRLPMVPSVSPPVAVTDRPPIDADSVSQAHRKVPATLSPEQAAAVFARFRSAMWRCLEAAGITTGTRVTIKADVVIDPSGRVSSAKASAGFVVGAVSCIEALLKAMTFPRFRGAPQPITYTYEFP